MSVEEAVVKAKAIAAKLNALDVAKSAEAAPADIEAGNEIK